MGIWQMEQIVPRMVPMLMVSRLVFTHFLPISLTKSHSETLTLLAIEAEAPKTSADDQEVSVDYSVGYDDENSVCFPCTLLPLVTSTVVPTSINAN